MLLFLQHKCASNASTTATAWCDGEAVLAVAGLKGDIKLYNDEGQELEHAAIFRKDGGYHAVKLVYHASCKGLAVGWSDGKVEMYVQPFAGNENPEKSFSSPPNVHSGAIVFMQWSPDGERLITGDTAGTICVWKVSRYGELTRLTLYKKGEGNSLTDLVFYCCPTERGQKGERHQFCFGTESGVVSLADDRGVCTDVQHLSSRIDKVMYYEGAKRLIVITRSLVMVQYRVISSGSETAEKESGTSPNRGRKGVADTRDRVLQLMRIKLSISASGGLREVIWVGPGLMAAATGENLVRLWDVGKDESYILSLKDAGATSSKECAMSLGFNLYGRYLSVGTNSGKVLTWQYAGAYNYDSTSPSSFNNDSSAGASHVLAEYWVPQQMLSLGSGREGESDPDLSTISSLRWSVMNSGDGLLAASFRSNPIYILHETVLHSQLDVGKAALQLSNNSLRIEYDGSSQAPSPPVEVTTDIHIRGMHLQGDTLLVYNGREAQHLILQGAGLDPDMRRPFATAATSAQVDAMREQTFLIVGSRIEIVNLDGGYKSSIPFTDGEGHPTHIDINGDFLAAATDKGFIKLYDLCRRESGAGQGLQVRPLGSARSLKASGKPLGNVRSIRCNARGTCVSIVVDRILGESSTGVHEPNTRLYVYDADTDKMLHYDFADNFRYPVTHFWDPTDPRFLVCETRRVWRRISGGAEDKENKGPSPPPPQQKRLSSPTDSKWGGDAALAQAARQAAKARSEAMTEYPEKGNAPEVTTFFVSSEHGITMQDSLPIVHPLESLLGVIVPRLYFLAADQCIEEEEKMPRIHQRVVASRLLRDFVGTDHHQTDAGTIKALLDFSFHLTVGDMDQAYATVRLIRNHSVWENMAHMCIKTKRLDVAEVCLGNMGHARGAAALRRAKKEPEEDVQVATLAIQLGRLDEAAALLRGCGRSDMLNELYRAAGLWDRSLSIAEGRDRIHRQSTHHLYAQHLERVGDASGAIRHYEAADTHRTEVPRMLFDKGRLIDLEDYVSSTNDPALFKWWAQYCESLGHRAKAQNFYKSANDSLNLVRLACYEDDIELARKIAEDSGSPAASYHLARHLESMGQVQSAIKLYAQSQCFHHAIRIAKATGMDAELTTFALQASPSLQVDVGMYFEKKGDLSRAAQLYSKAGDTTRALELYLERSPLENGGRNSVAADVSGEQLCTLIKDFQMQQQQARLDGSTEPNAHKLSSLIVRCSNFLVSNGQLEQAAKLLVSVGEWDSAAELVLSSPAVKLTDELVEDLTPLPQGDGADKEFETARLNVIQKLARACKRQGLWHSAGKKYTQLGDRIKAMKCLIKSGDTKNVVQFASVSRNRDVYILAANYLQNLNWHDDGSISKSIVTFYTKAKAYLQLSMFYEACADVELDEYQNYSKAEAALGQALSYAQKANEPATDALIDRIQNRRAVITNFQAAQNTESPSRSVEILRGILYNSGHDHQYINMGVVYSLLLTKLGDIGDWNSAFDELQRMKASGIKAESFIDLSLVDKICSESGHEEESIGMARGYHHTEAEFGESGNQDDDSIGEELEEELDEEGDDNSIQFRK